jgi:phosphatidylinositol-4,5-bisphosphate 3-kinase
MADGLVPVDCLLPSGILVQLPCKAIWSLDLIKSQLFDEARSYPLFSLLQDKSCYVFVGVNEDAEREELVDESKTLEEVRLFQPLLKVVEKKGNQEEKRLNAEISQTIGKRLADFTNLGPEVSEFRKNTLKVCKTAVEDRQRTWQERLAHAFPPNVEEKPLLPTHECNLPAGNKLQLDVKMATAGGHSPAQSHTTTVQVDVSSKPSDVIEAVFNRKSIQIDGSPQDYLLKVCGREEYLIKDYQLHHYKYIRQCIAKSLRPELLLHSCKDMLESLRQDPAISALAPIEGDVPPLPARGKSLWQLPAAEKLKIRVIGAKNVTAGELYKLQVKAGVYHGRDSLSCIGNTRLSDTKTTVPGWNEFMVFETAIGDLPRNARLCFVIYGVIDSGSKGKGGGRSLFRRKQDQVPIAWVNMNVFDYRGQLQTGQKTLYCWHVDGSLDDVLNHIGTTVMNPNTSNCISLEVNIELGVSIGSPIIYPSVDDVSSY